MTNTCTTRASSKRILCAGLAALLLAGCVNDSASYLIDGSKEHTIMLHRVQDWFWQDAVEVTIAPTRMPDCRGGISVQDVPRKASLELYQAPPEYAEPIYILKIGQRHYAISTQSCRVQEFKQPPPSLGTRLGAFHEVGGRLVFQPAK